MRKICLLCLLLGGCDLWDTITSGQEGEAAGKPDDAPDLPEAGGERAGFAPVCDGEADTPHPYAADRCGSDVAAILDDGRSFSTIQGAIDEEDGTVFVCPGTHGEALTSSGATPVSLAAASGSAADTILDGGGDQVLSAMGDVELHNLTVRNGGYASLIPAVEVEGGVDVGCTVFENNHIAIHAFEPMDVTRPLRIRRSSFSDGTGGALSFYGGDTVVEDTVFSDNRAADTDITLLAGVDVDIMNVTITGNRGGVSVAHIIGESINVDGLTAEDNKGEGGIDIIGSTLNLSAIAVRQIKSDGAGMNLVADTALQARDLIFEDNESEYAGVDIIAGSVRLVDGWVQRNTTNDGITLSIVSETTTSVETLRVDGNTSARGSVDIYGDVVTLQDISLKSDNSGNQSKGFHVVSDDTLRVNTLVMEDNQGQGSGASLNGWLTYVDGASFKNNQYPKGSLVRTHGDEINFQSISMEGNAALRGALEALGGSVHIGASTFVDNQSEQNSVIEVMGEDVTVEGSSFSRNRSDRWGILNVSGGAESSIKSSAFVGNTSGKTGALVLEGSSPIIVQDVMVADNVSETGVGGIDLRRAFNASIRLERVQLDNNSTSDPEMCSALMAEGTYGVTFVDSSITNNSGAAVCVDWWGPGHDGVLLRSENTGWGTVAGGDDNADGDLVSPCGTFDSLGDAETFSCENGVLSR